jgi:hypothetical protein
MKKPDSQLPLARTEKLIIKEIDDEVLVYDLTADKAHCLNHTAALVWKNCDGEKSVRDIESALSADAGKPVDENVVWLALEQLEKFNLLAKAATPPAVFAGMNRRQVMRGLSLAAIALPAVVSIIAPNAVSAASCNQACNSAGDCTTPGCGTCSTVTGPGGPKVCHA